jgi:signal transduction histidine kinase/ActR/RegA family two-component response regulator
VPVRFRSKDGRIVDLLIDSNVKYDAEGKFAHTRCFIRDDTKRKVREARSSLLVAETKRSLKMLDSFMSRSIHHLRTPLHLMQGTCELIAELLRNPNASGDFIEALVLLDEAAENIGDAVNLADDITILARLDQGAELEIKKENVDIRELGQEALDSVHGALSDAQLAFEQTEGCPSVISTDKKTLKRILRQLLDNAVKATSECGIVKLSIGYESNRCTFTVDDSGHGFEMKEAAPGSGSLPAIFQRYHQELLPEDVIDFEEASNLRSRIEESLSSHRKNSIGIGLSLSYFLVQALGGELRCASAIGQGAKFWFSLPVPEPLPCDAAPMPSMGLFFYEKSLSVKDEISLPPPSPRNWNVEKLESEKMAVKELPQEAFLPPPIPKENIAQFGLDAMDRPSVLVVEDTAMCAKILCKILGKLECSSTWAKDGQEAVDILRSSTPNTYNLILMDLRMPVLDGLSATRIIKNELKLTTPVVALTADIGSEIRAECTAVGFDEFCSKPMKREQLKEIIQRQTGYVA